MKNNRISVDSISPASISSADDGISRSDDSAICARIAAEDAQRRGAPEPHHDVENSVGPDALNFLRGWRVGEVEAELERGHRQRVLGGPHESIGGDGVAHRRQTRDEAYPLRQRAVREPASRSFREARRVCSSRSPHSLRSTVRSGRCISVTAGPLTVIAVVISTSADLENGDLRTEQ